MVIWKSSELVDSVISGRFRGLWDTIFGSGTISTTHDRRYMVIGMSSELVDSVNSGRFRGL